MVSVPLNVSRDCRCLGFVLLVAFAKLFGDSVVEGVVGGCPLARFQHLAEFSNAELERAVCLHGVSSV